MILRRRLDHPGYDVCRSLGSEIEGTAVTSFLDAQGVAKCYEGLWEAVRA